MRQARAIENTIGGIQTTAKSTNGTPRLSIDGRQLAPLSDGRLRSTDTSVVNGVGRCVGTS